MCPLIDRGRTAPEPSLPPSQPESTRETRKPAPPQALTLRSRQIPRQLIVPGTRAPRRIRTADPFITNEVLYQLSYWGYASRRLNGRGASRKDEKSSRCCFCGLPVDLLVEAAEVDGQFEHEHIEAGVAEREELLTLLSPEMCCDWH